MTRPLRIGMTGGIGSGKSTAAACFKSLGVPVFDADDLTREITAPGEPVLAEIRELFGDAAIDEEGRLARAFLRNSVFNDDDKRRRLEALLHPRVYELLERYSDELNTDYVVWVVPLLLESHSADRVDRILVVDCPEETQVQRARQRDRQSETDIRNIMTKQLSRSARLEQADDILLNDTSRKKLQAGVEELHRFYLSLARQMSHTPTVRT